MTLTTIARQVLTCDAGVNCWWNGNWYIGSFNANLSNFFTLNIAVITNMISLFWIKYNQFNNFCLFHLIFNGKDIRWYSRIMLILMMVKIIRKWSGTVTLSSVLYSPQNVSYMRESNYVWFIQINFFFS